MKPSIKRTFTTSASPDVVHRYLADFRNATEWDPGTQTCELIEGDGGAGSRYRNVSSFLGRTTELEYVTEEHRAPTWLHLVGRNEQFEGHDRISIEAHDAGSRVTYAAQFELKGLSALASPLVAAYLPVLGSKTVQQLKGCLDSLPTDA
ncbi:SRPBCC family protein, partial [Nocardioides sp.]|uniref:SRPBCC family protein n=1 Tax=Nocardioides sp. TaxID=35761 RepID=UPI002734AB1A